MDKVTFMKAVSDYFGDGFFSIDQWENTVKNRRRKISFRIFSEKAADANPYYFSSKLMHKCLSAAWEVTSTDEMKKPAGKEAEILSLYKNGNDDILYKNFLYFVSHDIYNIIRIAGGHRSSISNDTEIDISALLLPETSKEDFMKRIEKICTTFNVKVIEL